MPSVGVSRILNFESFPIEFSPSISHLEESFDTPISPDIVKWLDPVTSQWQVLILLEIEWLP
jgi:hypothetical protein